MIARVERLKTKRISARRNTSARQTSFRHRSEPESHPVMGLPDSYEAWLSNSAAKEIDQYYCA
jgi:hypothetical protein